MQAAKLSAAFTGPFCSRMAAPRRPHLMTLVRPDTDRIELEHRTAGTEVNLTVLEVPDEA